jgi:HEXXH motif-containing protein
VASPWRWVPDAKPWTLGLVGAVARWEPDPALRMDAGAVRAAVAESAQAAAPWLRHPCISRLTQRGPPSLYRDLCLAAWVAANCGKELGPVRLPHPTILWSGAGDEEVAAGWHELSTLGALAGQPSLVPLALDVWCRSAGVVSPDAWAALSGPELIARQGELERSVKSFLATVALLSRRCGDLMGWLTSATRVVRPLAPLADAARSSHDPQVPGLVEADISRGPTQTIELVAHETAHLHLRAAQAAGDLVAPSHAGTYPSPLRAEPRPLIGVLLAYHALAYICAALSDAAGAGVIDRDTAARSLADLRRRRDEARTVIESAGKHFTDAGAAFVDKTHEVADHVFA